MDTREKIQVPITYRKEKYYFYLSALWQEEENDIRALFRDLDDDDPQKREKSFEICLDTFRQYAVDLPICVKDATGLKPKEPIFPENTSVAEAIEKFFSELTVRTQRIATGLLNNYFVAQTQDLDF